MFSVLVLLEDSENVWSDRLRQKMANPAAKNRFFHFRHAVGGGGITVDFWIIKVHSSNNILKTSEYIWEHLRVSIEHQWTPESILKTFKNFYGTFENIFSLS